MQVLPAPGVKHEKTKSGKKQGEFTKTGKGQKDLKI